MFIKIILYILLAIVLISITYNAIRFFVNYNKTPDTSSVVNNAASNPKSTWPPFVNNCPDYWQDLGHGHCKNSYGISVNENDLKRCVDNSNQHVTEWKKNFQGMSNLQKCEWTKHCGRIPGVQAVWQGIDGLC